MGNKKTKREAGQLLKSYGLPKLSLYYEKDLSKKAVAKLEKLGFKGDKGSSFFEIEG